MAYINPRLKKWGETSPVSHIKLYPWIQSIVSNAVLIWSRMTSRSRIKSRSFHSFRRACCAQTNTQENKKFARTNRVCKWRNHIGVERSSKSYVF